MKETIAQNSTKKQHIEVVLRTETISKDSVDVLLTIYPNENILLPNNGFCNAMYFINNMIEISVRNRNCPFYKLECGDNIFYTSKKSDTINYKIRIPSNLPIGLIKIELDYIPTTTPNYKKHQSALLQYLDLNQNNLYAISSEIEKDIIETFRGHVYDTTSANKILQVVTPDKKR